MLAQNVILKPAVSVILYSPLTPAGISLAKQISRAEGHITRRKANITEKDDCESNRLFLGAGDRSRTCTAGPPAPKAGASANSATPANINVNIIIH